ncbi:U4/U6.U5 tri-snRNP-associated protein 1-like [Uranotaenia lowii]|uniref:U4/U6.U5 tri-snRNP-associated protein 1-like n=1 Tax=Uranotaenia lowii TaxID=190385 RepID=UPI0024799168|nr:U4/U6.U5 tri-snRNP-associated protein 1-like [Uranotaenia lowii]
MGSSKKHKKESKKHKRRSRSRSPHEKRSRSYSYEEVEQQEDYQQPPADYEQRSRHRRDEESGSERTHRHKKHSKKDRAPVVPEEKSRKRHRYEEESGGGTSQGVGKSRDRERRRDRKYQEVDEDSDSSDCIEVPVDDSIPPPPPPITRRVATPEPEPVRPSRPVRRSPSPIVIASRRKSPSPPRIAPPRRRSPSPPRIAPPRRRSPSPPPPPDVSTFRRRSSPSPPPPIKISRRRSPSPPKRQKSMSPIPENGAGDCLSIEETNKLRAKLGLKPLETGPSENSTASKRDEDEPSSTKKDNLIKDDWGEFYHKPAANLAEKTKESKIRDKLKERKEKRAVEEKLKKVKTLGEDDEVDDLKNWVSRSRDKERLKKEAEQRAKLLDQLDEEFGVGDLVDQEVRQAKKNAYRENDLRGLRVEHDVEEFKEGRQVILTLKDAAVLDETEDTLVNVNMMDDERYKRNIENKKQNPNNYGYDVYDQDDVDEFGMPKERNVLGKYDEDLDGRKKKSSFQLGSNAEHEAAEKRKQLEIRAKLQNKKLESLNTAGALLLASDYLTETEMASFKKPKKKVRKVRQKLRADDLLASVPGASSSQDLGSRANRRQDGQPRHGVPEPPARNRRRDLLLTDDTPDFQEDLSNIRVEEDDEDLQSVLSKARRLKQKEAIISKALPIDPERVKQEIKTEEDSEEDEPSYGERTKDGGILLNATSEFCRTLGDIPTYGLAGNREEDAAEIMDFEQEDNERESSRFERPDRSGAWNSVNPEKEYDDQAGPSGEPVDEIAILDEEPDVASSVAGALKLAESKGYLEKEDANRPSNARFAHLQAQNYSIEDKNYGDDDKYSRRDRFSGPIMDFREKETFKPNVKLEYIDDSGHLLTPKEAFRYLSHKFHGKGPGKNKVEKRLKKSEQEGLMKKMSSTDTPLGTLNMLQQKQKETQSPFVVLSGTKQNTSIVKHKR